MVIDQTSNKAIINWNTFSIGAGESVRFNQPSASSIALNRVLGNTRSEIFGSLTANGQIFLVNPNGVLMARGYKVALVTDGRMSGASGAVPAAIHVTPESLVGGPLSRVRDGDVIRLDAKLRTLEVRVPAHEWDRRIPADAPPASAFGMGREMFGGFRRMVSAAEEGAMVCL